MKRLGRELLNAEGKISTKALRQGHRQASVCAEEVGGSGEKGGGVPAGPCRCAQALGFHFILFYVHGKVLA